MGYKCESGQPSFCLLQFHSACQFLFPASWARRLPIAGARFSIPPPPYNSQVALWFSALGIRLIDVHRATSRQIPHDLLAPARHSNRLDIPPYALNTLAPAAPRQSDPAQDLNRFAHHKLQDNSGMGLDLGRGAC